MKTTEEVMLSYSTNTLRWFQSFKTQAINITQNNHQLMFR